MSILSDIITFDNGNIYLNRLKITKNKYGDSFINQGINYFQQYYFHFIFLGGINRSMLHNDYSFNTMQLFATMKGMISGKDNENYVQYCREEYSRLYKKSKESKIKNTIPNDYLNSFKNLDSEHHSLEYNSSANHSNVLPRIIPIGLLYWKKDKVNRKKLVKHTIQNIIVTHYNVKCYLSGITFALFLSYGKNNIHITKWSAILVEYLLSKEFEDIIRELDLFDDTFVIEKEQYITVWNEYNGLYLKKLFITKGSESFTHNLRMVTPYTRSQYLYDLSGNTDNFAYGLRGDDSILIAYDTLLYCTGSWEKIILMGTIGPTDNAVMGSICGALYGVVFKFESVLIDKYLKEDWVKKTLKLGKSLGL